MQVMRKFRTKNFTVRAMIEPDCDLDLSFDDSGEVTAALESGDMVAFQTKVAVYYHGAEIGADYLGGSIYREPREFFREHIGLAAKSRADGCNYGAYFPDMVREAISEARKHFADMPRLRK
jgi:hypothetical protein